MNKWIIIAAICLLPTAGFAKVKPKPTPAPTPVVVTTDYDTLITEAEAQIDELTAKLQSSLVQLRGTQHDLETASTQLSSATTQVKVLQVKIDEETKTLNKTIDDLNTQIKMTQDYRIKYEKAEKALWYYRRIAIGIGIVIFAYIAILVLKVMGKI